MGIESINTTTDAVSTATEISLDTESKPIITTTRVEKIDIQKIEDEMSYLLSVINNVPKIKEKPDEETLKFWNEMVQIKNEQIKTFQVQYDVLLALYTQISELIKK